MAYKVSAALVLQAIVTGILAIAFGLFFDATSFYHIHSFDKAFSEYIRNRTPEAEAALNVERAKLRHIRNVAAFNAALLFFFVSNSLYSLVRRKAQLAALSLLFACSVFLADVGLPSIPIDWRCCAYWGLGFDDGVSEAAVQISAISVWLTSVALFVFSLVLHHRHKLRGAGVTQT